jgi:hypothetical protein
VKTAKAFSKSICNEVLNSYFNSRVIDTSIYLNNSNKTWVFGKFGVGYGMVKMIEKYRLI